MKNVIVIDDQPYIRKLLIEEITEIGYQVYGFEPERNIIESIRKVNPDLIILDLYMGSPDGFDIFKDIKTLFPALPVIIFTAYDNFKNDPLISSADAYIVKSSVLEPLKQVITELAAQSQQYISMQECLLR